MFYKRSLQGQLLFAWDGYLAVMQFGLLLLVLMLFVAGGRKYDLLQRITGPGLALPHVTL